MDPLPLSMTAAGGAATLAGIALGALEVADRARAIRGYLWPSGAVRIGPRWRRTTWRAGRITTRPALRDTSTMSVVDRLELLEGEAFAGGLNRWQRETEVDALLARALGANGQTWLSLALLVVGLVLATLGGTLA